MCGTQYKIDKCEGEAFYRVCQNVLDQAIDNDEKKTAPVMCVNKYIRMKTFTNVRPAASSTYTVLSADSDITLVT